MRHLRRLVPAALVVALGLASTVSGVSVASAHESEPTGGRVVAPIGTFDGVTASDMLGEIWYRLYSLPAADNPWFGNGDQCMRLGRTGGVLYNANPGRDRACTVTQGTPIFNNGFFTACSSAEPPYSDAETAQRRCALASDESVKASLISIDGGRPVDVRKAQYGVFSPQRRLTLPRENILEIAPQRITLTAHGWMYMIFDLPPGLHAIRHDDRFVDGSEPYVSTKWFKVVRR